MEFVKFNCPAFVSATRTGFKLQCNPYDFTSLNLGDSIRIDDVVGIIEVVWSSSIVECTSNSFPNAGQHTSFEIELEAYYRAKGA